MRTLFDPARLLTAALGHYTIRLARDSAELRRAQVLRFQVFNLELNEGLPECAATGYDADIFDEVCDHLIVEHLPTSEIVGTYRLQTGLTAATRRGYYSEQEFDFLPYEPIRSELVELGRACVHRQHRNLVVLGLLWRGIAQYARDHGARYLCGCSSLTSQDPAAGATAFAELCRNHLIEPRWRTQPWPAFDCSLDHLCDEPPKIPKLLRAYLAFGAKICGPPALDRKFKTIDFLTFLDLESLPAIARERVLAPLPLG
jgi:putative hemolysin